MIKSLRAILDRWSARLIFVLVAVDVLVGVAFRFKSSSKLWLDEAQSVNIAAQPFGQIIHYLRLDGAPPLYYFVLHVWMNVVGRSDFDVRALSGVFGVLALGAVYFAARAWWGQFSALLALGVFATMPYAVYFSTETRMYSLVMLLSAVFIWILRLHIDRPRRVTAAGLTVVGTLLLYTHYWAIYLLGAVGLYGLVRNYLRRRELTRSDWLLPAAVTTAFILFLPWVPIFNSQRLHTGTPWSTSPTILDLATWFEGFSVNQSVPHIVTSLHTVVTIVVMTLLMVFGVFGQRMTKESALVSLDYRGVDETRAFGFIVFVTMGVGLAAGYVGHSAFVPRYAAVIAVLVTFAVARGITNFATPLRMLIVFGLLSGAALWTDKWGAGSQRTQAGQIATALADVQPGAVVFVCPDQLGPTLLRYANPTLTYVGYPRFETPKIVNWYDYLDQYHAHTPAQYAQRAAALVTTNQRVFVVRAHFYSLKATCWSFATHLAQDLHRVSVPVVRENIGGFYQPMEMQELKPATP